MSAARFGVRIPICIVLLLAWFAATSSAQNFRGGINGTVTDQTGAALPNVSVVATAVATGVSHTTAVSDAGEFVFQELPVGTYNVVASDSGFQSVKVESVPVSAGTMYTLQLKLSVARPLPRLK